LNSSAITTGAIKLYRCLIPAPDIQVCILLLHIPRLENTQERWEGNYNHQARITTFIVLKHRSNKGLQGDTDRLPEGAFGYNASGS